MKSNYSIELEKTLQSKLSEIEGKNNKIQNLQEQIENLRNEITILRNNSSNVHENPSAANFCPDEITFPKSIIKESHFTLLEDSNGKLNQFVGKEKVEHEVIYVKIIYNLTNKIKDLNDKNHIRGDEIVKIKKFSISSKLKSEFLIIFI